MARKKATSRKRKPRSKLVEEIIAAQTAVVGTFDAEGPAPPSFAPERYSPLTEVVISIEGDWSELRHHLYAGRIRGFVWTEQGQLVPMPADDWASPKNNDAWRTGRAVKLNQAIVGGRDLEGFALIRASDLAVVKPMTRETTAKAENDCRKWLADQMSSGQRKTKPKRDYQVDAQKQFRIGTRAFNRAWDNAIADSGNTNWRKPGRTS